MTHQKQETGSIERRYFNVSNLEIRKKEDGSATLEGFAAVFNKRSEKLGWGFFEVVAETAFDTVLGSSDCRSLFNHDENLILGREAANTLRLEKRDEGLWMSVDLPDTQYARDLQVSVDRGDITSQSFAFIVKTDSWEYNRDNGEETRTIWEVKELLDVSPVTFPAYTDTTLAKRSRDKASDQKTDNSLTSLTTALDAASPENRSTLISRIEAVVEKFKSDHENRSETTGETLPENPESDDSEDTKPTLNLLRKKNELKSKMINYEV